MIVQTTYEPCINRIPKNTADYYWGRTWKSSATMSQPTEFGDKIVPQWYANLPKHGVPQGSIVSFLCVLSADVQIGNSVEP